MPSKPRARVSFADNLDNRSESESQKDNISVTQEAIKKMGKSLSNILCFRATDSRDQNTRRHQNRTKEIHDLIGSKVCLKLHNQKSKSRNRAGTKIRLDIKKPTQYETESDHRKSIELSDRSDSTPTYTSQIRSSTATKYNHYLRPARTYCDIYRNSLAKLRSGFSQLSQRPIQKEAQRSQQIYESYIESTNVDRDLSSLDLKKSVHIYEFTEAQIQKIRKNGCIKLNVKVKPEDCINDIDLIIDKNQVVAIASTTSANANTDHDQK
ncbi:hypothetical protein WDU94_013502 [Cyamophila willieti]